jgi:hypothetical protein
MGTALAVQDADIGAPVVRQQGVRLGVLRPVASAADILSAQNETRALVAATLVQDRDYGVIPGTKKPTLLKPGAERVCLGFGLTAEYDVVEQECDHDRVVGWTKRSWKWGQKKGEKVWFEDSGTSLGLYRYVVRCSLRHREYGVIVATGLASCSTMEAKYIDRPRDLENTVLKMAEKRALIAAVLNATGLSDQFTQDVEDMDLGATPTREEDQTDGNGPSRAPAVATRATTPAAEPAPARVERPSLADALDVACPLGGGQSKPMGAVPTKRIESYVKWCRENGRENSAVYAAALVVLGARALGESPEPVSSRAKPAVEAPAPAPAPADEDMPAALADPEDDLPF